MEIENQETQKKPHLSLEVRKKIVEYKDFGYSGDDIFKILSASKSTCNECIGSIDDVSNRPMTGRPKKVTEEESKMLIETTKAHPNLSLTQLKMESGVNI